MKNFKRVVSGCLVSIFILSAGTLPAYAYNPYDGNYRDTVCTVKAINNSDGTPYGTGFREKRNSSSAYVKSAKSNVSNLYCWVERTNNPNSNIYGDCVDRYYGHNTYDGASKTKSEYRQVGITICPIM